MDNLGSNQQHDAIRGDTSAAIDFLKSMHPIGPWALTAIDPEKKAGAVTATFSPPSEAAARDFIDLWNGRRNLYFAVNHPRAAMSKKAKATDIASVQYLHVDIDPRVGEDLESERARILALFDENLPTGVPKPTVVVFSGGGYQAFWKLEEPLVLDGSEAAAENAKLWNMQLERLFNADSCHNIDRIMRLPGTVNVPDEKKRKKGRVPTLATLVEADWARVYRLDDFVPAPPTSPPPLPHCDNDNHVIDTGAELVKLTDVNELDKHTADGKPVDDRTKRIVQVGFDELESKPGAKPKDDRSRWVFDVACSLVRRGVPDHVILSVLLDRDFRISDHLFDRKGDTRKYAVRQISRAKDRVALDEAEFQVNKDGQPLRQSQRNVEVALAKMGLLVKLDSFRNRMLVEGLEAADVVVDDRIMTRLRLETDRRFKFLCAKDFYFDVVGDLAFRNSYHPVRDYLDGLTWDGEGRLDDWLTRYCGAEDSEFVRAVGRIVLLAAARRVRRPGCKFDEMLVLEGAQGIGKSQVLNALAVKEEWFSDEVPLAGDGKLAIEALNGRWIAEAAELKGMKNKEVEHLKAFLSRTHDRGRLAYDRITSEVPRQFIIVGTTNSEHYLMDIHGLMYELQPIAFEGRIWGVKPVCQHLRIIPDFCSFRGRFAVGGNETTPNADNNAYQGQPQSGVWFGKTDDLWQWGRPAGWGGPWRKAAVKAGAPSEPFLMTGFTHKMVHLKSDKPTVMTIEIDFLGDGSWERYERIPVNGYARHVFPAGFSAHWVRVTSSASCTASVEFMYTI